MEFQPETLETWSGGRWQRLPAGPVRGFAFDSRKVTAGDLFICLKTDRRDGHDFLAEAAAAGAVGAVVSRVCAKSGLAQLLVEDPLAALGKIAAGHRRRFAGPVVGVTGSCGKTSTKDLLALLLGGPSHVHATPGNYNNRIGAPLSLLGIDPTRHRFAVIEAGVNEPGEMAELAAMIRPTHVVVTLVAPAHLEKLGDLAGVAREKAVLAAAVPHSGAVVFPASCLLFEPFHDLPASVCTVGREDDGVAPDVFYRMERTDGSTVLHLRGSANGSGSEIFTLRKVSAGMAANAALAIEVARMIGVSDPVIQERLLHWSPGNNRGEAVTHGKTRYYLDSYNANPAAMEDSLDFFDALAAEAERRLYILGCMGELGVDSATYHRDLGRNIRLRDGDRMFITGGVEVWALREGLLAGGADPGAIRVFENLEEIEDEVIGSGAFVFVKGSRVHALERLVERARSRAGRRDAC